MSAPIFDPRKREKHRVNVHFYMDDPDLWNRACEVARSRHMSQGQFVEQALRFALDHMSTLPGLDRSRGYCAEFVDGHWVPKHE